MNSTKRWSTNPRVGDVFVLGTSTWRVTDIGPDRVEVIPAPGEPAAKLPFWKGDTLGRSIATGKRIGRFVQGDRCPRA